MPCPICDKDGQEAYRPFCSKRCADLDLAKWLGGSYAIPSQNPDDYDELLDAMEQAKVDPETDDTPPRPS